MSPSPLPSRTLHADRLSCRRGDLVLFEEVSFTLEPGEALLVRGPNGVGKSTLLSALAGLHPIEAGGLRVEGRHQDQAPLADIALLSHRPAIKARLTLVEDLRFWADLLGGAREGIMEALDAVGLGAVPDLEAGHLSAGQARRLSLARLLLLNRPIWILDEPSASLDQKGEELLGQMLDDQLRRGGLVIAATHHDLPLGTHRVHVRQLARPQ